MKLTFRKSFEAVNVGSPVAVVPCTVDGELIDDVISCSVSSAVDEFTEMTIKVSVRETLAENTAVRMKK